MEKGKKNKAKKELRLSLLRRDKIPRMILKDHYSPAIEPMNLESRTQPN